MSYGCGFVRNYSLLGMAVASGCSKNSQRIIEAAMLLLSTTALNGISVLGSNFFTRFYCFCFWQRGQSVSLRRVPLSR